MNSKFRLITWAFGIFVSSLAFGDFKLPTPQLETLPNGLQLVWFVSESLPVVDLSLMVRSGYRDDPQGKTGTASLLASSLERGAGGMTAQEISSAVEKLGASRFISADEEVFSIGMHGLAPDASTLLGLMAKIALHPDFPEAEIAREHARLLDRWNHIGDYGESLVSLAYQRLMTAGTSYGRGSFLSVHEFQKVKRADVMEFYKKHFTPKNSILMIVGRVNPVEFRKQILSEFGSWQGERPVRKRLQFSDRRIQAKKGQVILVERQGLTQAQVRIGFKAPLVQAPEHYSLVVANALLGEYFNSRLNSVIRDQLGLTYSIGSGFSYSRDLAEFTISSATRNESVGKLIQKTIEILKELKKGPIPQKEVEMAKEYLVGGFPLSIATLGSAASRWMTHYLFDLGIERLNQFVPQVKEVKSEEVLAAVVKDFDLDHLVIVVAGDGKEVGKSLAASPYASFRRVSARDLM